MPPGVSSGFRAAGARGRGFRSRGSRRRRGRIAGAQEPGGHRIRRDDVVAAAILVRADEARGAVGGQLAGVAVINEIIARRHSLVRRRRQQMRAGQHAGRGVHVVDDLVAERLVVVLRQQDDMAGAGQLVDRAGAAILVGAFRSVVGDHLVRLDGRGALHGDDMAVRDVLLVVAVPFQRLVGGDVDRLLAVGLVGEHRGRVWHRHGRCPGWRGLRVPSWQAPSIAAVFMMTRRALIA